VDEQTQHAVREHHAQTGWLCPRRRLQALQAAVPALVAGLERSLDGAHHAAVAITTTDLVSKSAALEVCGCARPSCPGPSGSLAHTESPTIDRSRDTATQKFSSCVD
jgi:hypothetical protein